jgi:putative transposase
MSYWKLFYHFVWATKNREPVISDKFDDILKRSIRTNCQILPVKLHAIETMPDHVHIVVSVSPALSLASFMNKIKGASSHAITDQEPVRHFNWQSQYGVHSFSEDVLPRIVEYVVNQRSYHENRRMWPSLEVIQDPETL